MQEDSKDSIWLVQRSIELFRKGAQLTYQRQYIEALDTFKLAVKYKIKAYNGTPKKMGSWYMALGVAYKNIGQIEIALRYFDQAEKAYNSTPNTPTSSFSKLYSNMANAYRAKLDFLTALNYALKSQQVLKTKNPTIRDNTEAIYSLSELNYRIKNYEKSKELALSIYNTTSPRVSIYSLNLLANIEQKLGNTIKAQYYFQKAIQKAKSNFGPRNAEFSAALLHYSDFLINSGKLTNAQQVLTEAASVFFGSGIKKGPLIAEYYLLLGNYKRAMPVASAQPELFNRFKIENIKKAIDYYEQALQALLITDTPPEIETLKPGSTLSFNKTLDVLKAIGDSHKEIAFINRNDTTACMQSLDEALFYYQNINHLIQRARQELISDESKIMLSELEYNTFVKTVETAYEAYTRSLRPEYINIAFISSEQIKSSALYDKIANDIAMKSSLIPDSLLELEARLNTMIAQSAEKIFEEKSKEEPDTSKISRYESIILDASRRRETLFRDMEKNFPKYYELKYAPNLMGISKIQPQIDSKDAIINYMVTEEDSITNIFSIVLTRHTQSFHKVALNNMQMQNFQEVYSFISSPEFLLSTTEKIKHYCNSSFQLYQYLLAPIRNEIPGKNITILPHGILNYIPFDGLICCLPDTNKMIQFGKLDYLLRYYNINYANSANILVKSKNKQRFFNNRTLAIAPEYHTEKAEFTHGNYVLPPLPGVQKEVEAIASTIPTKIIKGDEATEKNFREQCADYDILHLAMHAFINDAYPAYSRMAFSPCTYGNTNSDEDGWLNTIEVYNLELNARLAVLSACNTGSGKLAQGEGLMSLARGFLYAGCPAIIVSLWEVEDDAGTQLMASFYKNLRQGKSKDEALRLAKLEYVTSVNNRLAHPHYWLGFKCIGDNTPIFISYDFLLVGVIAILLITFSVSQVKRMKKARRKRRAS